jgi:hypothetical protein
MKCGGAREKLYGITGGLKVTGRKTREQVVLLLIELLKT